MGIDIAVIVVYMVVINIIGITSSRAATVGDYFLGNRSMPWPLVCFSIVATETSTLTFISIPGLAYITGMGFLQIAVGYIAGRILVSTILLPRYFAGNLDTAYQFIHNRFGLSARRIMAVIFHITRLLADSIRLFATAIPLSMLMGFDGYWQSILIIGAATFIYTYYGGIKSVIIVDSIQLMLYLLCAAMGIYFAADMLGMPVLSVFKKINPADIKVFSLGFSQGTESLFGSYNIFSGIIGGAFLSFASHGTDHLIVQRVLSCRDLESGRKAMIVSGFAVLMQFAVFMVLGLFIKVLLGGRSFELPDTIMPFFIINKLPHGVKGLMLAGIFAAAMSTLSSSINSLSSSTVIDIIRISEKNIPESEKLRQSRIVSLIWTIVIMGIAVFLKDNKSPLVELGLSIASITYGGMLGIFLQGVFFDDFNDRAAIAGVIISIIFIVFIAGFFKIFWPWFVPAGFIVSFFSGIVINRFIKSDK